MRMWRDPVKGDEIRKQHKQDPLWYRQMRKREVDMATELTLAVRDVRNVREIAQGLTTQGEPKSTVYFTVEDQGTTREYMITVNEVR